MWTYFGAHPKLLFLSLNVYEGANMGKQTLGQVLKIQK